MSIAGEPDPGWFSGFLGAKEPAQKGQPAPAPQAGVAAGAAGWTAIAAAGAAALYAVYSFLAWLWQLLSWFVAGVITVAGKIILYGGGALGGGAAFCLFIDLVGLRVIARVRDLLAQHRMKTDGIAREPARTMRNLHRGWNAGTLSPDVARLVDQALEGARQPTTLGCTRVVLFYLSRAVTRGKVPLGISPADFFRPIPVALVRRDAVLFARLVAPAMPAIAAVVRRRRGNPSPLELPKVARRPELPRPVIPVAPRAEPPVRAANAPAEAPARNRAGVVECVERFHPRAGKEQHFRSVEAIDPQVLRVRLDALCANPPSPDEAAPLLAKLGEELEQTAALSGGLVGDAARLRDEVSVLRQLAGGRFDEWYEAEEAKRVRRFKGENVQLDPCFDHPDSSGRLQHRRESWQRLIAARRQGRA